MNGQSKAVETLMLHRPWTWRDKLRIKLFPPANCELPEAPPTHKDVLVCRVFCELAILARLRVLFSGRCAVEARTVTENVIGDHKTATCFMALPPKWMDR